MLEFYHISDLHIKKSKRSNKKAVELLKKIFVQFDFENSKGKFLIITGDITQAGKLDEYRNAKAALSDFKEKIFIVPGNHDYGTTFSIFYDDKAAKRFDSILANEFAAGHSFYSKDLFIKEIVGSDEKVLLIGINSCLIKDMTATLIQRAGQSIGLIGYSQLDTLFHILNSGDFDDYKKIVFLHHIPDKYAKEFFMELLDRDDLILIAGPHVDVLCYGHQGEMSPPPASAKAAIPTVRKRQMEVRRMKVKNNIRRSFKGFKGGPKKGPYSLDANDSVDESACYRITVDKKTLSCDLLKVE